MAGKISNVHHADGGIWGIFAITGKQVAHHRLVGGAGNQGIGAGEVNNFKNGVFGFPHAGFFLDRDTGIVGDLLMQAGQGVKKSGLAAVRVAY